MTTPRRWLALFCLSCAPAPSLTREPTPTVAPAPSLVVEGELLPGVSCKKAPMPSWQLSGGKAAVAGFAVTPPAGWRIERPRPDLVVVTSPVTVGGVRPVFEVFVSPICKSYRVTEVHDRIAARGLLELLPRENTVGQMERGHWRGGLGGRVGRGVTVDVTLETPAGPRQLVVWGSDIAEADTVGVHAAALCPAEQRQACEDAYFNMLK